MLETTLETLSWGITGALSSTIRCLKLNFKTKSIINIVVMTTILSMMRGYTGKNIVVLLLA